MTSVKICAWNVRGFNASEKNLFACKYLRDNDISVCGFLETKVKKKKEWAVLNRFPRDWRAFSNCTDASRERIWVFWDPCALCLSVVDVCPQAVHCEIKSHHFFATFVYAFNSKIERTSCWRFIGDLNVSSAEAWTVMGDLNCVLEPSDKWPVTYGRVDEFEELNTFMEECRLTDLDYLGQRLTWSNSKIGAERVERKLDRVLVNEKWKDIMPLSKAFFDTTWFSDHSPAVIAIRDVERRTGLPFRFKILV